MNQWIDFKELRKQLDFAKILAHYKVEVKLKGDQHHGFCPLPTHDGKRNSASFSANVRKGIWQCFGCGKSGNLIDFAVLMEGAVPESGDDVRRIALELKERFLGFTAPEKEAKQEVRPAEENVIVNPPLDFELKNLDAGHPYLLRRGFTAATISEFGLGYCSRGSLRDRIGIPLRDNAGRLIGYAGRVVDDSTISEENPKYRFPGKRERNGSVLDFRKSLFLYNAHRIKGPVMDLKVVEGFASVWWLWQSGVADAVATMGASLSEEQIGGIVSLVAPSGRLWILSDGDDAGSRWAESILSQIAPNRFTRWVKPEAGKQPTDLSAVELNKCFAT